MAVQDACSGGGGGLYKANYKLLEEGGLNPVLGVCVHACSGEAKFWKRKAAAQIGVYVFIQTSTFMTRRECVCFLKRTFLIG